MKRKIIIIFLLILLLLITIVVIAPRCTVLMFGQVHQTCTCKGLELSVPSIGNITNPDTLSVTKCVGRADEILITEVWR